MIFIQDRLSSIALITFLCYLFKYALAPTHALKQLHSQVNIVIDWKRQTEHRTLTQTNTHTHLCALLFPSPAVLANDALVFLSLNALQNEWHLKMICHHCLFCFCFFPFFFKTSNLYSKTWASQVIRNKVIFNSSSTFRKFHVFLKNKNINAHIAQLSCTLVCLKPTALFWDNIRGFKPEYRTFCIRQFQWVSVAVFPSLYIHTSF